MFLRKSGLVIDEILCLLFGSTFIYYAFALAIFMYMFDCYAHERIKTEKPDVYKKIYGGYPPGDEGILLVPVFSKVINKELKIMKDEILKYKYAKVLYLFCRGWPVYIFIGFLSMGCV